jgi:HlyD family secretion protein
MKKGAKIGIGVVVLGAIVTLSVIASRRNEPPTMVKIEPVSTRDLVATVNASGWIRPNRRVDVQADIMGRITELNVQEGEAVRKGQVLLRIDPTQYEAAVGRAEAAVSEALSREAQTKANVLQAERQHARLQQLAQSDQNLVSRQQLEEAETQLAVQKQLLTAAGFGIEQARSAVAEARDRLSKTIIRAPMDGVITRLNVEEGSTAIIGTMNNPGSLLLTVADLSTMEAVVHVDETDLPDIHLGDSASIAIDAFPRQRFTGKVTKISYSAVRSPLQSGAPTGAQGGQAIDYEIVITLDNPPPALRSDLSVAADIVTAKRPGVLSIPIIALTVRERGATTPIENEDPQARAASEAATGPRDGEGDEEGVFVVREGKARFVAVKVGIAGEEHFEVISGLAAKDSVVAGPYEAVRSLEDGKPVKPMPAATPATSRAGNSAPSGGQ